MNKAIRKSTISIPPTKLSTSASASAPGPTPAPKKTLWAELTIPQVNGLTLQAQIPMILPPGEYKTPDLSSIRDQDSIWLKNWLVKSGLIRRGDTGEDILARAKAIATGSALFIPDVEPTSVRMRIYTYFFALAVFMDDLIEGKNLLGREKEMGLKIATLGGEVILGKFASFDDLPEVYPVVKPIFKALFIASAEAREYIEDFDLNCRDFVKATNESFTGMALMQLEDSLEDDAMALPEDHFIFLRQYDGGAQAFIELAALIVGITLPDSMKQNILLRRIMDLACMIVSHVNDLVGVRTDVDKREGFSLVMFKAKTMPLAEAFQQVNLLVQEQIANLVALAGRLRALYPKNKRLDRYLRVVEHVVDGHLHFCTYTYKYGDVKVNWVERVENEIPLPMAMVDACRNLKISN